MTIVQRFPTYRPRRSLTRTEHLVIGIAASASYLFVWVLSLGLPPYAAAAATPLQITAVLIMKLIYVGGSIFYAMKIKESLQGLRR